MALGDSSRCLCGERSNDCFTAETQRTAESQGKNKLGTLLAQSELFPFLCSCYYFENVN